MDSTGIYYIHSNHLDTPQVITDQSQTIVWAANYTPFGEATITTAAITNNLRFPGQYFDEETGNHYNYFRDYDPNLGRYVQSDPLGIEAGVNTYTYVVNNPVRYIDPRGLLHLGGQLNPLNPPANTVACDGNGGFKILLSPRNSRICGIEPCVLAHELVHLSQLRMGMSNSQGICRGARPNTAILYDSNQEAVAFERPAYLEQIDCLQRTSEGCDGIFCDLARSSVISQLRTTFQLLYGESL